MRNFKSDERKLEFIESAIKGGMPTEVKITALISMAEIHKDKKWFNSAAKNFSSAADLAPTFREKIDLYFKTAVMYLQVGEYFRAEDNFRKVLVLANNEQRSEIREKINIIYLELSEKYEKERRYSKAIQAYTKILTLNFPLKKTIEIYDKLIFLYSKVGKPREAKLVEEKKKSRIEEEEEKLRKEREEKIKREDEERKKPEVFHSI